MPIKLPCPNCNGVGKIPLPKHLDAVLRLVKRGVATAERIKPKLRDEISVSGVHQRLYDLHRLGLVDRVRRGRYLHYTAT
jgi:uncharacterized membrane protein